MKPLSAAVRSQLPPEGQLCAALGVADLDLSWLSGDGSDRSYYRLQGPKLRVEPASAQPQSWVLMHLQSQQDQQALAAARYDWLNVLRSLQAAAIPCPQLVASLPQWGCLVISDCGDWRLETAVLQLERENQQAAILALYQQAFSLLASFLRLRPSCEAVWTQRAFDREKFTWELGFFQKKYLEKAAGLQFTAAQAERFQEDVDSLSSFLALRPAAFVHRDFHSRNLMLQRQANRPPEQGTLVVIDFQDARLGPYAYDLVSLCFDAYVPFSYAQRCQLVAAGIAQLGQSLGAEVEKELRESWKAMLLQRQLKAIGSFAYLSLEKNKGDYLAYVAPALDSLQEVYDPRWPFLSGDLLARMRA